MPTKLSDALVKALEAPDKAQAITFDTDVKGFGVRVTKAGAKSFILDYRTLSGHQRRFTIGAWPAWKTATARTEAADLRRRVDRGDDPMAEVHAERSAPTVADLCTRYIAEELTKRRPSTVRGYLVSIDKDIRPLLGKALVADLTHTDVDRLHRRITARGKPIAANRAVAVFSKMLSLAVRWGWRADNPARGIERNGENRRERYLSPAEIASLFAALDASADQTFANIIRLALLTGARRGEVQAMRWADVDLDGATWTKPAAATKQKKTHRVPLSPPVVETLATLKAAALAARKVRRKAGDIAPHADEEFVFTFDGQPYKRDQRKAWQALLKAAGIDDAHMHDLRHTYASVLVSSGLSLPIIGALLGHSQPATTSRYAHLADDPLRAATTAVADIVAGARAGEVRQR